MSDMNYEEGKNRVQEACVHNGAKYTVRVTPVTAHKVSNFGQSLSRNALQASSVRTRLTIRFGRALLLYRYVSDTTLC